MDEGRIINDYIVLVSRVAVKHLPQLEFLSELAQKVLNYHMIKQPIEFFYGLSFLEIYIPRTPDGTWI